jgi:hypothetical protein
MKKKVRSKLPFILKKITNTEVLSETMQYKPSIGASHQVSVHLAKQLQRGRFVEIDQSETRMTCGDHVY